MPTPHGSIGAISGSRVGGVVRWLVFLHPIITVLTIVATANHFFMDAIVAMVYVHVSEYAAIAAIRAVPALALGTEGLATQRQYHDLHGVSPQTCIA